jgi:hypothetical protein
MPASRARIMARTGSLSRPRKALRRERQRGLRQWRGGHRKPVVGRQNELATLPARVRSEQLVDRGIVVSQHRGVAGPCSELRTGDHVPLRPTLHNAGADRSDVEGVVGRDQDKVAASFVPSSQGFGLGGERHMIKYVSQCRHLGTRERERTVVEEIDHIDSLSGDYALEWAVEHAKRPAA